MIEVKFNNLGVRVTEKLYHINKNNYKYFKYNKKCNKHVKSPLTAKVKSHIISRTSQKNMHKVGDTHCNKNENWIPADRMGSRKEEYVCLHYIHSFNRLFSLLNHLP